MTTTTASYTVQHDACEDGYSWHVVDRDGDVFDSFRSKERAEKDARERNDEAEAEALRERIAARLEDLDLAALRRLAEAAGA